MDKRLLDVTACPACREELRYSGESDPRRLISGQLCCTGCGLVFPVEDEVALLVPPETDLDWADWEREEGIENLMTEWVSRNFNNYRTPGGLAFDPILQDFVNTLCALNGPIVDVASGPGGSWCVSMMEHGNTDGLFVMSDIGKVVMKVWRHQLRTVGWADRCSLIVFDARSMPFISGGITAITSVGGLGSVKGDKRAYEETARVLRPNGRLLELVMLYEEGGPTQKKKQEQGQVTTWFDYEALLHNLGLTIEKWNKYSAGRGKISPGDKYPQDDETWECRMVNAVRS